MRHKLLILAVSFVIFGHQVAFANNIFSAITAGDVKAATEALNGGIDVNARNSFGDTALENAAWIGQAEIVKLLLENGADINTVNANGYTPLINASMQGHADTVKILLENKATVSTSSKSGDTAISSAIKNNHPQVVKLLLENGVSADEIIDGNPALFFVIRKGYDEIAKLLLFYKADFEGRDNQGKSARTLALMYGKNELVAMMDNPDSIILAETSAPEKAEEAQPSTKTEAENVSAQPESKPATDSKATADTKTETANTADAQKATTEATSTPTETTKTQASTTHKSLVAPQAKKPGVAIILPYNKDTMSLKSFTSDKKNDSHIKVLVQGASPIVAIRLENMGGVAGSWNTKDNKTSAMGIIKVENKNSVLNPDNASFKIDISKALELDLIVQDNGSIAKKDNKFRVTFFHEDGSRTYSIVNR